MRYVIPTVKQAPTTMVWGSFSGRGRGGIWFMPKNTTINGAVYLNALKENLQQHMHILGCTVFQHDGAPCHRTVVIENWLNDTGIEVLEPWPGCNPDLNPIENLWTMVKRKVSEMNPTSEQSLIATIKKVWVTEITPAYCEKLISSMPQRVQAVLRNEGHHCKY